MKTFILSIALICVFNIEAQMPTKGLKGYYLFNNNANDSSGNGQHGNPFSVIPAKDRFNKDSSAYYFRAFKSSNIEIPVDSFLNNTYTYSAWAKINDFPEDNSVAMLLNIGGQGGDNYLGVANNYLSKYHGWFGGGYNTTTPNFDPTADNFGLNYDWNHIVCVRSSNFVLLYVNGVLKDSIGANNTVYPNYGSSTMGFIGIRNSMSSPFDGWIDDVAIYDRALSFKEVKMLYDYQPSTSIDMINTSNKISIYPNPSSENSFKIYSTSFNINQNNIKIYNSIGQLQNFESIQHNDQKIEISHNFSSGNYFIIITDEQSNTLQYKLQIP